MIWLFMSELRKIKFKIKKSKRDVLTSYRYLKITVIKKAALVYITTYIEKKAQTTLSIAFFQLANFYGFEQNLI